MKKLVAKKNVECMACLQCVAACSEAFYKEFDEDKSCVRIVAKGTGAKPNTCIQCGKCAKVCQMDVDVTRTPDHAECIRCGKCVGACPVDAISFRYGLGVTGNKPAQSAQARENK